jgi:hypothetical protein
MKNPETEAISGFCCKLLLQFEEKEELFFMIPRRELQMENLPFASLICIFVFICPHSDKPGSAI